MHRMIASAAAAMLFAFLALAPASAANFAVKDGNLVSQTIKVVTNGDGSFSYVHAAQDSAGTLIDPATKQLQQSILTAIGSPFQSGASIGNTAFGISGTLPAFAAVPTVDTVRPSASTDRGTIIGFSGAAISTTSASPTITLTTAPTSINGSAGGIVLGQQITAAGIPAGTTISALASGTLNATSSTYTLSANATATATGVAASSVGPQQIMAANSARRGVAYQVQSPAYDCYVNGVGSVTTDFHSMALWAKSYYASDPQHVGTGAISVMCTGPAVSFYSREF